MNAMQSEEHSRDEDHVVTKASPRSVTDTLARLMTEIAARNMKVFSVIDHSGEAAEVGLEMRDTKLVVFGSPLGGTPVMVANPLAALDLPLKILVWSDGTATKISYTAPRALATRYRLTAELTQRLAGIDALAQAVIDN
ncbi:hypothetical protein MAUB_29420 [Mycolicibacterium aubagnense]|uniref:DUF302 domain-containing protein n=2 Tax=Mycolicibacterium aubagnense TaxID=319707 RepID=A0ABM7IEG7_9MYCO|nr:hypothetical protein MAUB_29420 [Mycolicibacterium aubagnense]